MTDAPPDTPASVDPSPSPSSSPPPAWTDDRLTDPHAAADKADRVRRMFAAICRSYDRNNRVHSFGRDQAWRRRAVDLAQPKPDDVVIDVACGTGDLTLAFAERLTGRGKALGVDYTFEMLPLATRKRPRGGGDASVSYAAGDAMTLPLPDGCADVVSIAFGIRNVVDPAAALAEFRRVLRPGGRLVVLEFSRPRNPVIRRLNDVYSGRVMPRTATWISGDRSGAYRYLPRSVATFLDAPQLAQAMRDAGFADVCTRPVTFGVASIHVGRVPAGPGNTGDAAVR